MAFKVPSEPESQSLPWTDCTESNIPFYSSHLSLTWSVYLPSLNDRGKAVVSSLQGFALIITHAEKAHISSAYFYPCYQLSLQSAGSPPPPRPPPPPPPPAPLLSLLKVSWLWSGTGWGALRAVHCLLCVEKVLFSSVRKSLPDLLNPFLKQALEA